MAKGDQSQSILDRLFRRSSSDKGADDTHASDDSSGTVTADEGDASDDSSGTVTADEGDAIATGDAEIAPDESGDATVVTGTDADAIGEYQSPGEPAEYESPIDPTAFTRTPRIGAPQESDVAKEARLIEEATKPQLAPEVIEARLGGRGPQAPDPDDAPDELAFGKGAVGETAADHNMAPYEGVDDGTDPIAANPPADGLDPVGPALSDTGLDPVGGAPPDDGLGPHEVRIDDTTDHSEPTEVDID